MRLCKALAWTLAWTAAASAPAALDAHARLTFPVPRMRDTSKTGPCGGLPRGAAPLVLVAGQEIEVEWEEYIDHPGYYQLLFSTGGDRDFALLLDDIDDRPMEGGVNVYTASVRMPDAPCEEGTLQLIQIMTEIPQSPRLYFSCADIRLVEAGPAPEFLRGDVNANAALEIGDAVSTLVYLFDGGAEPGCLAAADFDLDGTVRISDPIAALGYLFLGYPGPGGLDPDCGPDASPSSLGCETGTACATP